jgi:hypothetical protein
MGITWAMGLRFRPMTSRFKAWNKEHVGVNGLCWFTELLSPETPYFMSYLHFNVFFQVFLDFVYAITFDPFVF